MLRKLSPNFVRYFPWMKYTENPVMSPGNPVFTVGESGQWDESFVGSVTVLFKDEEFHMWYGGADASVSSIGYATSSDGINWNRYCLQRHQQ